MNKILLSLLIIFIALTGIACVSASDFNETVDQDIVSGINETDVSIDDIVDDETSNNQESAEIENATEAAEENVTDMDNATEPVEDNVVENESSTGIVVENKTIDENSNPISLTAENESKLYPRDCFPIPNLKVYPAKVNTGDKLDDEAIYYYSYYLAYKGYFSIGWNPLYCPAYPQIRSMQALIGFIYQSHNEKETIDIVTRLIWRFQRDSLSFWVVSEDIERCIVENYFYTQMYTSNYDESYTTKKITPWNPKKDPSPFTPSPGPFNPDPNPLF